MSAGREIDLTRWQREILRNVFSRYADSIDQVAVYGSRVQGRARPGSDVDLVIHGDPSPGEMACMASDIEESDLSIFADLVAYDRITHAPLKKQIDHWAVPLFYKNELREMAAAQAA